MEAVPISDVPDTALDFTCDVTDDDDKFEGVDDKRRGNEFDLFLSPPTTDAALDDAAAATRATEDAAAA